jgi:hypothetical protein
MPARSSVSKSIAHIGAAHIELRETPPDVCGVVVHGDGFTVAANGLAMMVRLAPAEAKRVAHRLLLGAAKGLPHV